jgi:Transposase DDE domain
MSTILQHAQRLVYSVLALMPSVYQKASLNALLALLLEAQGHPLPQHTQVKSPSSLSRFLNRYAWSTRAVIRSTRQAILQQVKANPPQKNIPLRVIIDLTSLEKCGRFLHLSHPKDDIDRKEAWVRMLNGKRGLHLVVLYLEIADWRIPWSYRVWKGKGETTPNQLACKLLATIPKALTQGRTVQVLADTEFGTELFLNAVQKRGWRPIVGMRGNRKLADGRKLQDLYKTSKRGLQVKIEGINTPLTVSWFWLKRADNKRELRFVVSTYPYSGVYLVRLGRRRWAIEGFFKTIKHRFGLHCFGQSTRLGVYRWFVLVWISYLLAHWIDQWEFPPTLDWKVASESARMALFPSVVWLQLLKLIDKRVEIAAQFGFEIVLKRLPDIPY